MLRPAQAALVEYGLAVPPLALTFELNPQSLSRTRTISVKLGSTPATRGGYDFGSPAEAPRAAQGVTVHPESFNLDILLDATDRMEAGDPIATAHGIEPELDTLYAMVEPRVQGPGGVQLLAGLGLGQARAFQRQESPPVLLFVWGSHVLPVFLTSVRVDAKDFLPSLVPYRATVNLALQVIEGQNPFYRMEKARQVAGAALQTGGFSFQALAGLR